MSLLHQEIYEYQGYSHCESRCRIRVYELSGGALVIVASELTGELAYLGENEGTSITNRAEHLATAWRLRYPACPLVWIEHYAARGCSWTRQGQRVWQIGETFDRVRFTWNNRLQCYQRPQWRHLGRTGLERLIGETWGDLSTEPAQESDLGDLADLFNAGAWEITTVQINAAAVMHGMAERNAQVQALTTWLNEHMPTPDPAVQQRRLDELREHFGIKGEQE